MVAGGVTGCAATAARGAGAVVTAFGRAGAGGSGGAGGAAGAGDPPLRPSAAIGSAAGPVWRSASIASTVPALVSCDSRLPTADCRLSTVDSRLTTPNSPLCGGVTYGGVFADGLSKSITTVLRSLRA